MQTGFIVKHTVFGRPSGRLFFLLHSFLLYVIIKATARTGTTPIIFGYNGRDGVVTDANGLLYMRARYYSPALRRFINADILAGSMDDSTTLNRYAYANGNPVMNVDPLGLMSETALMKKLALDEKKWESYTDNNVYSIYDQIKAIGQRAIVEDGVIRINLDKEWKKIDKLSQYVNIFKIFDIIAAEACDKYRDTFGQEFLFSDSCVSYEIQGHYFAYMWAIGEEIFPNSLASIWGILNWRSPKASVYDATRSTDMWEKDATESFSQALFFNYKNGIRDHYIGTDRDPWKDER